MTLTPTSPRTATAVKRPRHKPAHEWPGVDIACRLDGKVKRSAGNVDKKADECAAWRPKNLTSLHRACLHVLRAFGSNVLLSCGPDHCAPLRARTALFWRAWCHGRQARILPRRHEGHVGVTKKKMGFTLRLSHDLTCGRPSGGQEKPIRCGGRHALQRWRAWTATVKRPTQARLNARVCRRREVGRCDVGQRRSQSRARTTN